jgi:hypothetical protein
MAILARGTTGTVVSSRKKSLSRGEQESLVDLGNLLEKDIPWLIRAIASQADRLDGTRRFDPIRTSAPDLVLMNKKRRSARSLLVHLFKGEVDDYFVTTLHSTMLPILRHGQAGDGAAILDYIQGLLTACLFSQFQENLVPQARMQGALDRAFDLMR